LGTLPLEHRAVERELLAKARTSLSSKSKYVPVNRGFVLRFRKMANTVQKEISATCFLHNENCFYTFNKTVKKILIDVAAKINIMLEPNTDR
jgi:hypothetical protein